MGKITPPELDLRAGTMNDAHNFQYVASAPNVDGASLDLIWRSKKLWSFLGPRLGHGPFDNRISKAGGEERKVLD